MGVLAKRQRRVLGGQETFGSWGLAQGSDPEACDSTFHSFPAGHTGFFCSSNTPSPVLPQGLSTLPGYRPSYPCTALTAFLSRLNRPAFTEVSLTTL